MDEAALSLPKVSGAVSGERRALLVRNTILSMLSPGELDRVAEFAHVQRYNDGDVIFRKGDNAGNLMLVINGHVKIRTLGADGKEAVLAVLSEGDVLGEMAILDDWPRSADAVAVSHTELMVVQKRDFIPYLERNPKLAIRMLSVLCGRLRHTNEMLEERLLIGLPARLAKALLRLAHLDGEACKPGTRIDFDISQGVFASLLGASRETLNKQLNAWDEQGLIRMSRRSISIERPDALRAIAEMN